MKIQAALASGIFPAYAVKSSGTVDVWISYPSAFSFEEVKKQLAENNFDIVATTYIAQHVIVVRVSTLRLHELASLSAVEFIQAAPPGDKALNFFSRTNSRANILNKLTANGGRNLLGNGVTIGVGDNADPQHVDFSGRKISRAAAPANYHGTHVSGTAAGGGIWNELYAGYAPKSTLINQVFSGIWLNAAAYYNDHRMVISNNSYGNESLDCAYSGFYDFTARFLDAQAFSLPKVTHVFASGNSGIGFPLDCTPFPAGYKSVLGGYQVAKNVLTVGNVYADNVIFPQSSRGPARDGRIKPEITAQGAFVYSTSTFADYSYNTGTSMAAPGVAGGLALLYERYRQIFGSLSDPDNALVKALVCNTADDRGKPGPDYSYGFGTMNILRAVEALEANQYTAGTISTGGDITFDINVPANTAQLKVMLYWNDPLPAVVATKALVNNLDLRLTTIAPATYLPLVLDPRPAKVEDDALPKVDTLNNIEQVTINNPSGTYTVHVAGTLVPTGPQNYYVTYDIVPVSTVLTFPTGGEKMIPGDQVLINWDSHGGTAETFTLEYSTDNGASWSTINSSIAANLRFFVWNIPATVTNEARVRITKNSTAQVSTSNVFTVLGAPALSLSAVQCEGYISVDWTPVAGATQYEVMKLKGDEMVSVAIVSSAVNTYAIGGLSKDSTYWVTVRAINNGFIGRRDTAVFRQPNNGTCAGAISDNDLKLDSLISPSSSGRKFTSTELTATVPVTIQIKNLDDVVSNTTVTVSYYINDILQESQNISPSINPFNTPGSIVTHTFSMQANLAAVGVYPITVKISKAGDPVVANDTLRKIIKQLDNQPVALPFTDNMDGAPIETVMQQQMGLENLDRYDFISSGPLGRLRTFVNSGIAYSGNRALTLDAERFNAGTADSLTGTYNIDLTGYLPATDEIRLDFRYKNHGQTNDAANKVWIRGSDAGVWKQAYDLFANQNPADGTFKLTGSIEVSDILAAGPAQPFTPSFQIRWGQWGINQAADNESGAGYTIDNIHLYKVTDDMQMVSINAPLTAGCGLSANTPVTITVRNSRNTAVPAVPGVPVRFRVDGGGWTNDVIPGIGANSTTPPFTFATGANFSAPGLHLLEVEVVYPSDTFDDNDTLSLVINNLPVITSFPSLENFESNEGSWYTSGKLSSWEYGTPSSIKITRAASGSKAWKTRLNGTYNDNELSYLNSPCYNVSTMANPTLSFSVAFDIEDCGGVMCDGAYVEYSTDGNTWSRLGANGQGTNWYNKSFVSNNLWALEDYARWHVATIPLSVTGVPVVNMTQMRFRFVMNSDQALNKDGIAIDDIHIYDNTAGIYDGATMGAPVTQNIPGGTGWVNFTSGSKLVASVNSPVVNMGSTSVQAFINPGSVRYTSTQYYHDRNITIKPTNIGLGIDSATVRFYFLDTETEALLNATGCATCYKPSMAYELGVSKYSDPDDNFENGTITDDLQGTWLFINSASAVKVPFDKGYYTEFKVRDFSEFLA